MLTVSGTQRSTPSASKGVFHQCQSTSQSRSGNSRRAEEEKYRLEYVHRRGFVESRSGIGSPGLFGTAQIYITDRLSSIYIFSHIDTAFQASKPLPPLIIPSVVSPNHSTPASPSKRARNHGRTLFCTTTMSLGSICLRVSG